MQRGFQSGDVFFVRTPANYSPLQNRCQRRAVVMKQPYVRMGYVCVRNHSRFCGVVSGGRPPMAKSMALGLCKYDTRKGIKSTGVV